MTDRQKALGALLTALDKLRDSKEHFDKLEQKDPAQRDRMMANGLLNDARDCISSAIIILRAALETPELPDKDKDHRAVIEARGRMVAEINRRENERIADIAALKGYVFSDVKGPEFQTENTNINIIEGKIFQLIPPDVIERACVALSQAVSVIEEIGIGKAAVIEKEIKPHLNRWQESLTEIQKYRSAK